MARKTSLHNQKFELQFLTAEDIAEIELPKFSGETKAGPPLIKVYQELQSQTAPEIREAHVSTYWMQHCFGVERKGCALRDEAGEGVTVEVVSMRGVGGPIWIRVMRRNDLQSPTRFGNPVQLGDELEHIGNMLDHMPANDLVEFVSGEGIRKDTKIMDDVRISARVGIDTDRSGKFVATATNIQNSLRRVTFRESFSHADD